MTNKSYVVERCIRLWDVQQFVVEHALDERDAQRQAELLIAASPSQVDGVIAGVRQIACEIVDAGESADWQIKKLN